MSDEFLDSAELAARYRVTTTTVRSWRMRGDGPPWIKVTRGRVLYRLSDVEAWEAENRHATTAVSATS